MKVYEAISKVAAAMSQEGISKARKNTMQNYHFRGIDDVLNALSSALTEAGLVILPRVVDRECVERQTAKGGAIFYVTVNVEFDLVAVEDGSKHTVVTYGEAMDSADKATNKAMSAAYKYLALLTFCIPTEATPDNEADFSSHDVQPNKKTDASQSPAKKLNKIKDKAAEIMQMVNTGKAAAAAADLSKDASLDAIWNLIPAEIQEKLSAAWPETIE